MDVDRKPESAGAFSPGPPEIADLDDLAGFLAESRRIIQLTIRGSSMAPLLRAGDWTTLRFVAPERLRAGDIAAFREGGAVVLHRLVDVKRPAGRLRFYQAGDNCETGSWIAGEAILGKLVTIHRGNRSLHMNTFPWRWINPWKACWPGLRMKTPESGPTRRAVHKAVCLVLKVVDRVLNRAIKACC